MSKKASRTRPRGSRWACLAVEADNIVSVIKEAARERQGKRTDLNIMEQIPESQTSSQQIADLFNTNEKYIRDAEKLKTENPVAFEQVKSGEKTLTKIKQEEQKESAEIIADHMTINNILA